MCSQVWLYDQYLSEFIMCGLGNQIVAHAHRLRAFNCARDRVALSTVTALDAAQNDRRDSSEA